MNFKQKIKKGYYFFKNPISKLYCYIFRPKSLGVKVIIENIINNKILMVRLGYAHKKWTFPGGKVEKSESFEKAGIRETKEEVGIEALNLVEMGEYKSDSNYRKNIVKCFYLDVNSDFVKIDNFEIIDSCWCNLEELPLDCSFAVPKILEIYKKFKSK